MQDISRIKDYAEIVASDYWLEWAIDIGDTGRLITEAGDYITFGSGAGLTRILIAASGADAGYGENMLISVAINQGMFDNTPILGKCVSAELEVEMYAPEMNIPRMAMVRAFCRACNEEKKSGWLDKGTYYIDTRKTDEDLNGDRRLTLHCYDAMLKTEQAYVWNLTAGATDVQVVGDIAGQLQWTVDARTWEIMTAGYQIMSEQIGQYTMREILGYIAGMYAGCFIISPGGELRLVQLTTVPGETNYLAVVDAGVTYTLTFGEGEGLTRILV
ncbi:MAG: hypothetical protein HUJ67_02780 [Ruminiclostridium sp.]|nr:hypothetical protein [Ruminiclostridium sp.]